MKSLRFFMLMALLMSFSVCLHSQDVRGLKWGMNQETVKRIETSNGVTFTQSGLDATLTGSGMVDGKACFLIYNFDYFKKALTGVGMAFNVPLFGKRQDRVNEFVEILSAKYGSYSREGNNFVWENRRTKITLTPEAPKGNISIYYESLVKSNNLRDF